MSDQLQFDYDVFISYSSRDKEWVRGELLKRLEKAGLRAFIDFRDFRRGSPSIKGMERGVITCRKTLLVLTPDYLESGWCEIESIMLQTLDPANRDLRLIPLLKAECKKPLRIGALTHIDFTDGADVDLAWGQLLTALNAQEERTAEAAIPKEIQAELDKAKELTDADKYSEAIPILEKVLPAADNSGHTVARVKVRLSLANALYEAREDVTGAEGHYRDALILVPVENLDLKHSVLIGLGNMLLVSGRLDEAKAVIHTALDVAKMSGKTDDLAASLISISLLERTLGFHDSAIAKLDETINLQLQQALSLSGEEKNHNAYVLAVCYLNKALLYQDAGNFDEALTLYGKANEQYRSSGDKLDTGKALLFRGEIHCANADWEKGFDCFRQAFECFKEAANPLWTARCLKHFSDLYATHEMWEKALQSMLGAAAGAKESGHTGEQVHFLCLSAKLLRKWKATVGRENVSKIIHKLGKDIPADKQGNLVPELLTTLDEMSEAVEQAVREDEQVRDLLKQAKEIAQREGFNEHLANCLLDEAYEMTPPGDSSTRHNLVAQAIELLREELRKAQSPNRRGHLMGRISGLYREIGEEREALSWLKKSGEIFEKTGDAFALASFYESLAEMYREEGRQEEEIAAHRRALSVIEGRSFYRLTARTQINLAATLLHCREFREAEKLLTDAEALCDRHYFKDFIPVIARVRSEIKRESRASQAPTHTLTQMLESLRQLLEYRPEHAVSYLTFWYFAWNTELIALLRSGPHLSFMVVTDDVERFLNFAAKFRHLADHFLMTTSTSPTIKAEGGVLPIPPTWLFPAGFPFIGIKRKTTESGPEKQEAERDEEEPPANYRLVGPATMLPPYMLVDAKSKVEGEGHIMALFAPYLPQEAIDLMIHRPVEELIQRRAVWCPTDRIISKDPFLTDLRIAYERRVFLVYFDHLPTSESVAICGGVEITIASTLLGEDRLPMAAKWRRALLKLITLSKSEAQTALLDLPEVFADADGQGSNTILIEVHLFEFSEAGQRLFCPVLLVRGE
ncbi:MAG TPA: TIR domain-containing protein [Pyrinomonadaceae bacterium]|jgi:tetratricopeptide (TPR) repeat protein|nr:TIR domain-containing protein [Pyrinomonadaceae bacterium]